MAEKKSTGTNFSEDVFGRKIDRCLTDTIVKGGELMVDFVPILHNLITNKFCCECSSNVYLKLIGEKFITLTRLEHIGHQIMNM